MIQYFSGIKNNFLLVAALTILWLGAGCGNSVKDSKQTEQTTDSIQIFTEDGAWCWFSDPRAVYYQGVHKRTYSGWVSRNGSIVVSYYDHELQTFETDTLHQELQVDDHNNPSFLIDSEGKLMVFYSKHSSKSPILLARGKYPESINEWEPLQQLALNDSSLFEATSNTYTYTNIVRLSEENNKLYLFWRGIDFKPNFSTSQDDGHTWDKGKLLVLPDRIYRNRRPYLKVGTNSTNTIHFAFTDGHPRDEPTNSIYYSRYKNDSLFKADGSVIKPWSTVPLDPAESDLVYDASTANEKAWIWDVAGDADGNPALVYSRFPNDSTHVYYYAVWNNREWKNTRLVNSGGWFPQTPAGKDEREPNYSGGIALDHSNPSVLYLSIEKMGVFEIERWETENYGEKWSKTEITSNSKSDNIRPFVVRNHPSENSSMVLWMNFRNYVHYTDYDSSIKLSF